MGKLEALVFRFYLYRLSLLLATSVLFGDKVAAFVGSANRSFRSRGGIAPCSTSFSLWLVKDENGAETTYGSREEVINAASIRPFHQNWWPVATTSSLKADRPNQVQVLGQPLVAFLDTNSQKWSILDDRCSHRFAPLSEGRVIDCNKIQCAYHGWEFAADGTCVRVPQQSDRVDKARKVQAYSVREDLGIIWVWMDPETSGSMAEAISLPVNPLARLCHGAFGERSVFMRDLPYGMEILGENLLDLSHLPYAHHSVSGLDRSLGTELPTRMLSLAERIQNSDWETSYGGCKPSSNPVLPFAQAEISRAADHDPIFITRGRTAEPEVKGKWTTTIGYYDPCHVRYRRSEGTKGSASHVELFLCPTSEGRSRVFLLNCFEKLLPSDQPTSLAKQLRPSQLRAKLMKVIFSRVIGGHRGHLFAHKIFDGDGIFLHKQGNRMRVANLTFKDYSTPASADVLLNSYRRFLDSAASKTRQVGLDSMANAVVGSGTYGDDAPRHEMLDRYNTHTVHCPSCLGALQNARKKKSMLESAKTIFQGATGSGIAALGTLTAIRKFCSVAFSSSVFGYVSLVVCMGFAGSYCSEAMVQKTKKEIDSFIFEDYVHAEKI